MSVAFRLLNAAALASFGCCLMAVPASSQGRDTIILADRPPVHAGEARLVPGVTFGRRGGAAPEYLIGSVRDVAVAPNGSVYVLDNPDAAGAYTLRQFDPNGRFSRTVGRVGQGPGEFNNPRSIWVDDSGVLHVYSARRVERYDSTGRSLGGVTLTIASTTATSETLLVDTAGTIWILINVLPRGVAPGRGAIDELLQGYQRLFSSGGAVDTVLRPGPDGRPARSRAPAAVPFAPRFHSELSPHGHFVTGFSGSYTINLQRTVPDQGGVISIRRGHAPVRVHPEEFNDWNAPGGGRGNAPSPPGNPGASGDTPRVKPAFDDIRIGLDGRIWVSIPAVAQMNSAADAAALSGSAYARARWPTPLLFDLFEANGTYVGRVRFPAELSTAARFVARGDRIWVALVDAAGEPVIQQYRVVW
jgi:hypothetical protein